MSVRVSPEWLALREAADAAARSAELAERLGPHRVIHDLGGGTGSMGRWLAPRLPGPQHWVIHDRDQDLLELVDLPAATVETRVSDVARLDPSDLAGADLVTASALLDLLTADELARILRAARRTRWTTASARRSTPTSAAPACSARTPSGDSRASCVRARGGSARLTPP